jgi:hypothetical protein
VGKDAALEVLAKGLADVGLVGVVVALPVELACVGEFMPGLEVHGECLGDQRAIGVAGMGECQYGMDA